MKKLTLCLAALVALLGIHASCQAADAAKPVAVVSIAGYDRIVADVDLIGTVSGNPALSETFKGLITAYTQGKGPAGLDTRRPWGMTINATDGGEPSACVFLPVTDLKQLMEVLKPFVGEVSEEGGAYKIQLPNKVHVVKKVGDWAVMVDTMEDFAKVPADPSQLLGDLPKRYDVAIQVNIAALPESARTMVIAAVETGAATQMQKTPGESDEEFASRKLGSEMGLNAVRTYLNEGELTTVGFAIDQTAKKAHLDVVVTAKEGTSMAKALSSVAPIPSSMAGLQVAEAALTLHTALKFDPQSAVKLAALTTESRKNALASLKAQKLPDEDRELLTTVLNTLFDVGEASLKSGVVDRGAAVVVKPDALTIIAGSVISEGGKLESAMRKAMEAIAKKAPDVAKLVKLDAETVKGVKIHTAAIPIPTDAENREQLVKMVGQQMEIAAGTSETKVFFAGGRDAAKHVKAAIEKPASGSASADNVLGSFSLALGQIAQLVADVGNDEAKPIASMLSMILAQSAGKDHINLITTTVPRGGQVRLEIEEGVIKLIGAGARMAAAGVGGN